MDQHALGRAAQDEHARSRMSVDAHGEKIRAVLPSGGRTTEGCTDPIVTASVYHCASNDIGSPADRLRALFFRMLRIRRADPH